MTIEELEQRHAEIEARMAAIRTAAEAQGRRPSEAETAELNDLSVERAAAYRAWQAERAKQPSNIVAGAAVFRSHDRRRTLYGSREQAIAASELDQAWALEYWNDEGEMEPLAVEPQLGDFALAVSEPYLLFGAELNWVMLWVVDGPLQYCFWTVASDDGLPPALVEVAAATVALE